MTATHSPPNSSIGSRRSWPVPVAATGQALARRLVGAEEGVGLAGVAPLVVQLGANQQVVQPVAVPGRGTDGTASAPREFPDERRAGVTEKATVEAIAIVVQVVVWALGPVARKEGGARRHQEVGVGDRVLAGLRVCLVFPDVALEHAAALEQSPHARGVSAPESALCRRNSVGSGPRGRGDRCARQGPVRSRPWA